MMYQGIAAPKRRRAARTISANNWKSDLFFTGVTATIPLGPVTPSRVPCPPATVNAATFPDCKSSIPFVRASS
jgi:hypothetical protein